VAVVIEADGSYRLTGGILTEPRLKWAPSTEQVVITVPVPGGLAAIATVGLEDLEFALARLRSRAEVER